MLSLNDTPLEMITACEETFPCIRKTPAILTYSTRYSQYDPLEAQSNVRSFFLRSWFVHTRTVSHLSLYPLSEARAAMEAVPLISGMRILSSLPIGL